jgi:cytochrome c oxidase subunit IV
MSHGHEHTEEHSHAIGYGTYTIIWFALIALTAITVAVAGINLKDYTLFVAMLVATIKAMIVINVFMHVKFDNVVVKWFLVACGFIFATMFIFLALDVLLRY